MAPVLLGLLFFVLGLPFTTPWNLHVTAIGRQRAPVVTPDAKAFLRASPREGPKARLSQARADYHSGIDRGVLRWRNTPRRQHLDFPLNAPCKSC